MIDMQRSYSKYVLASCCTLVVVLNCWIVYWSTVNNVIGKKFGWTFCRSWWHFLRIVFYVLLTDRFQRKLLPTATCINNVKTLVSQSTQCTTFLVNAILHQSLRFGLCSRYYTLDRVLLNVFLYLFFFFLSVLYLNSTKILIFVWSITTQL